MLNINRTDGKENFFLALSPSVELSGYTNIISNFNKLPHLSTFTSNLSSNSNNINLFFIINNVQQSLNNINFFLLFEVKKWVNNFTMSNFIDNVSINGNILLTKDFSTNLNNKIYFYVFLSRKNSFSEVIKWLFYLTHLQSHPNLYQSLGVLFFEAFYYYDSSELSSIQNMIINNYNHNNIFVNLHNRSFNNLASIIL